MIIRWVKNLDEAAKGRAKAQAAMDGMEMTPAERRRVSDEIARCNRDIERYAGRINEDLKRAAAKRERVSYPRELESIQDRQLKDYCTSVRLTISKLNDQIGADGKNAGSYLRDLRNQRKHAVKVDQVAAKNEVSLSREDQKLLKRDKEVKGRRAGRETDLKKIEGELKRVAADRKKLEDENARVSGIFKKKDAELHELRGSLDDLGRRKKMEKDPDRRNTLRDKATKLEPQVAHLEQYLNDHLKFQLDQFEKIRERVQDESTKLNRARDAAEKDLEVLSAELADLKRLRGAIADNRDRESKRRVSVATCIKEVDKAQAQAKRAGVKV